MSPAFLTPNHKIDRRIERGYSWGIDVRVPWPSAVSWTGDPTVGFAKSTSWSRHAAKSRSNNAGWDGSQPI